MVVRMWLSTTAETSRAAARQPLPSSQTRQSTARASGSSANEIENGNSPAIVLAMLPPQIVNCWVGVTWFMNRNTHARAGRQQRRRLAQAQQAERRPAGHREQEQAEHGHQLERHLVAQGQGERGDEHVREGEVEGQHGDAGEPAGRPAAHPPPRQQLLAQERGHVMVRPHVAARSRRLGQDKLPVQRLEKDEVDGAEGQQGEAALHPNGSGAGRGQPLAGEGRDRRQRCLLGSWSPAAMKPGSAW